MKRVFSTFLAAVMLAGCTASSSAPAAAASADTVTGASSTETNYYADAALTGDALWTAFDAYQLAPSLATVNEDGTPHIGVYIPGHHQEMDGEDYFIYGLAPNTSRSNLERTGKGELALYGGYDNEKGPLAGIGARISFEVVTDQKLIDKLAEADEAYKGDSMPLVCHVLEIKPLG